MRYLNTYQIFESSNKKLTKQDLDDMLVDISDMGFRVYTNLTTRTTIDRYTESPPGISNLIEIPYASIYILNGDIKSLVSGEEFYEFYKELSNRLNDFDWYISCMDICKPSDKEELPKNIKREIFNNVINHETWKIKIFLHKKEDLKYIK